jgi:hypothetical protein
MSVDPVHLGLDYLYQMRALAIDPELIDLVYDLKGRSAVCAWIGHHIRTVNAHLQQCLQACHACFHPWQQQSMQIFAVPFSERYGLDGLCNLHTHPITILVDVGRVESEDWLALVAHEYAHAHVGTGGHHAEFVAVLTHLGRGLGLVVPDPSAPESAWRTAPAYCRTSNPLAFWQGPLTPPLHR